LPLSPLSKGGACGWFRAICGLLIGRLSVKTSYTILDDQRHLYVRLEGV
jgi:hypothetical protein